MKSPHPEISVSGIWAFCFSCQFWTDPLIILGLHLEISLRMRTHRAHLGSLLSYADVTAVSALPDGVAVLWEHGFSLYIGNQLPVSLLMLLLHGRNARKQIRNLVESLFPCLLLGPPSYLPFIPSHPPHTQALHIHLVVCIGLAALHRTKLIRGLILFSQ